ncbi:MAG TPA: DUF2232 domain-containing protein [Xanthobacteraceae bacterium]|nr:DUF2232 domain-containing protein [Xanthobacteraceae bacterium]
MTQVVLIGIGAGATAALLFASVTGAGLSVILFYLAPLPIMIVALGWSHWAALVAAVVAAAMLGGTFGIFFFGTFLTSIGVPAWWLGYLALLGRPIAKGGAARMEWYPPGRLVLWAAMLGAAVIVSALATFGDDQATIRNGLKGALEQVLRLQTDVAADTPLRFPGIRDTDGVIDMLAAVLPPAAAVIAATTQTGNLWLAGRVVKLSGRLRRPWPDLTALSFPPLAAASFGALLVGSFLPGLAGLVASLCTATLTVAFAMVGFAVLHTITRHIRGRAAVLSGIYGTVILLIWLVWPVVIMALIGVAETLFGLRARISRRGPPAAPKT